jgi:hypothetical protein
MDPEKVRSLLRRVTISLLLVPICFVALVWLAPRGGEPSVVFTTVLVAMVLSFFLFAIGIGGLARNLGDKNGWVLTVLTLVIPPMGLFFFFMVRGHARRALEE